MTCLTYLQLARLPPNDNLMSRKAKIGMCNYSDILAADITAFALQFLSTKKEKQVHMTNMIYLQLLLPYLP